MALPSSLTGLSNGGGESATAQERHFEVSQGAAPLVDLHADAKYPLVVDPEQVGATEHFGVLRARVLNAYAKSGIRSIIISSPQKEEGKSMVSTNLAIALGQLGTHRVLLVDGDLRVMGLSLLLGVENSLGLADFLQQKAEFEACVHPTSLPGLSVVGAGAVEEESLPGILEGPKWSEFLQRAKEQFEIIVVDSVPIIAPIADFELLSATCDGVLLIIHLHKTTRDSLALATERVNGNLLGVVINNCEPHVGSDYYSYYYGKNGNKRSRK